MEIKVAKNTFKDASMSFLNAVTMTALGSLATPGFFLIK
jgi:hypothetical protein